MKKVLLSFLVIFSFAFYAMQRNLEATLPLNPSPNIQTNTQSNSGADTTPPSKNSTSLASSAPSAVPALISTSQTRPPVAQTPAPTPKPTPAPTPSPAPAPQGMYRDGQYVGNVADAYYGNVQVRAIIQGGKIVDVQFLDYPQDRRTSQMINSQAMPYLTQEAIQTQNANVDVISGATATSGAFRESLGVALAQAKN